MSYFDIKEWLQTRLGDDYEVTSELNLKADLTRIPTIYQALAGSVSDESASLPYQIDFYTNDAQTALNALTIFAKTYSNQSFNVGNYIIQSFFQTPTILESDIPVGNNHYCRIAIWCSFFVLFNVDLLQGITIDGEAIQWQEHSIAYATELDTDRVSGGALNKSDVKVGGITFTFRTINKAGVFTQKLRAIRLGIFPLNTRFSVELLYAGGAIEKYTMIIPNYSIAGARGVLPTLNVSLVEASA